MRATNTTPAVWWRRRVGALGALAALAGVWVLVAVGGAHAAGSSPVTTEQSKAADGAFLQYAPPPPGPPGALCLVDTGVNANPDTTPGLVYATAIDGGSGADADPQGHGTTMAMIAGGAGVGLRGAWPQLKIVSVRATTTPSPGQEPTYEFDDYTRAIRLCVQAAAQYHVDAIDLALASPIAPTSDQVQNLTNAVAQAHGQDIAIVAAAGNTPGPAQQPGAQPGILAVGAGDPTNGICSFSADQGLTLYAPGCNLDVADPSTDQYEPQLGGAGTSQASAFTAAVIVALMSYDPKLTASAAETLLLSTAKAGSLDVAAAFQADNLGPIVSQGNASTPPTPASPTTTTTTTVTLTETATSSTQPAAPAPPPVAAKPLALASVRVDGVRWQAGILTISVGAVPASGSLRATLLFAHQRSRTLDTRASVLRVRTARPQRVLLTLTDVGQDSATVTVIPRT